jgi:formyl-CoA transferase
MLTELPIGASEPFALVLSALRLDGAVPKLRRAPPSIGEHTDEILAEIGYSPAEIGHLRSAAVV